MTGNSFKKKQKNNNNNNKKNALKDSKLAIVTVNNYNLL